MVVMDNESNVMILGMNDEHITLPLAVDFELGIYKIYRDNTLVFIDRLLHSLLSPTVKEVMGIPAEEDDELTPTEILAKDVMYILTDDDFDKEEFLYMANSIKGSVVNYVTILNIQHVS